VDLAHAEAVDVKLARMIEGCPRRDEVDPDEREELWKESVRAYTVRRREEMRADWHGWHLEQADRHRRTLETLIARHEDEAAKLMDVPDLHRKDW
jgi:hypothetical protein